MFLWWTYFTTFPSKSIALFCSDVSKLLLFVSACYINAIFFFWKIEFSSLINDKFEINKDATQLRFYLKILATTIWALWKVWPSWTWKFLKNEVSSNCNDCSCSWCRTTHTSMDQGKWNAFLLLRKLFNCIYELVVLCGMSRVKNFQQL